jgi:acyl-CoA dehydrogenase
MVNSLHPLAFGSNEHTPGVERYVNHPAVERLVEFFESKGVVALKEEDRQETWYEDWIAYQAKHRIYASVLSPRELSSLGHELNLSKLARFLEVFGYFSPAHGYSLHVSFLGLFPIWMSENQSLRREAIAALENGGVFAFGVSEKQHGADLMNNEFVINKQPDGNFRADGSKYYIGNANIAAMISVLGKRQDGDARSRRAPFVFIALRPNQTKGFNQLRKIRTLGVRPAFVGEFHVSDHAFPPTDIICDGRDAWDAIFGTVTLGKFLLGFASIGICERALAEAMQHVRNRTLYGQPVIDMPHIATAIANAKARLTAMKLYAFRVLDYLQTADANDRRYPLLSCVQKARVSTEGVKVVQQLSECMGAKGFESDTYFEMALRDIQLIPSLESSTHVNFSQTAQFLQSYLFESDNAIKSPPALTVTEGSTVENPYLFHARTGGTRSVRFAPYARAWRPLSSISNVLVFARQARAFRRFARRFLKETKWADDMAATIALGRCLSTLVYGQLIAEHCTAAKVDADLVSVIFGQLVETFSGESLQIAALTRHGDELNRLIRDMYVSPWFART